MAFFRRRSPLTASIAHHSRNAKSTRASSQPKKMHLISAGMLLTLVLANFILTRHVIHMPSGRQTEVEGGAPALGGSYTFQHCTSPERSVPWPLNGAIASRTSSLKCGLPKEEDEKDSRLSRFLREETLPQLLQYQSECQRLVVYGVAFGEEYVASLSTIHTRRHLDSRALLNRHGRCFFMFCLEEDMPSSFHSNETMIGHTWLIPIPRDVLPYGSLRRNSKLLKYHGNFLFPYAQRIVWQDAKFFQRVNIRKQPTDYFAANYNDEACVATMSLPVHPNTFGWNYTTQGQVQQPHSLVGTSDGNERRLYRPQYMHHCNTIVEALQKRPDVTDSAQSLMHQCSSYMLYMQQQKQQKEDTTSIFRSTTSLTLDDGLLDSGFLVWNYATEKCRVFNAKLQCTLSDQLQCHSDRDQVSFPFVLAQMGLRVKKSKENEESFDQRRHDLQLVVHNSDFDQPSDTESNPVMVHMTKSACHWYYRALDDCQTIERPSVAILVAGTTKRFLLKSTAQHVLQPLVQTQNYTVDYYATLTQEQGPAYRQDAEYMNHITEDPIFRPQNNKTSSTVASIQSIMREVIESTGASLRGREIRKRALALNAPELQAKRRAARKRHPREDVDLRFPMLDQRYKRRPRTINGNRNMLKLFNGLQDLWDNKLIPFENSVGKQYDFIMILRDDALWLQDFDMAKLLALNPSADAYVQSCNARDPPMLQQEMNDFGIVIKREKAEVVGRYFSTLLSSDLDACHVSVQNATSQRGCNSEMILNWILQQNNITVQGVPQSLLPFERSVVVRQSDGRTQHCFHKFCQSKEAPLRIPKSIPKCKDMVFS